MRSLLSLVCLLCACGDDHEVPFKRASSVPAGEDERAAAPAATVAHAGAGRSFPAQTHAFEHSGAKLELATGAIRAMLEVDLDREAIQELLLVVQDAAGKPQLAQSQRLSRGWAVPSAVAPLELGAGCELLQAELKALGASYAAIQADLACQPVTPPTPAAAAAPPVSPAPGSPAQPAVATARALWLATVERTPRVLEHWVLSLTGDPKIGASLHERDLDADGHADLLLALEVTATGGEPLRVETHFLNRAGGLARQPSEPERTLLDLADEAKAVRKQEAERALVLAERVLLVHGALCRESGRAKLTFGDAPGLPCGSSLAAGRAASIVTAVRAKQGNLLAALDQYASLSSPAYRLTENDWDRARSAILKKLEAGSFEWRTGPRPESQPGSLVRRSSVAFIDEAHLLLRGASPRSYDLASGAAAAIGLAADTRVTDPTGRLAVSAIVRSCQGFHLQIAQASQLVAGMVVGPALAEPLFAAADAPAGATCPQLQADLRKDEGGYQVLDWTAQGVLIARRERVLLLAIDASGQSAALAQPLSGAPPAQPHCAQLTPDARLFAFATSLGIALVDRTSGKARLLALPEGSSAGLPVTDLAISPSAKRIAVVRGGELWIGSPPEPPAP